VKLIILSNSQPGGLTNSLELLILGAEIGSELFSNNFAAVLRV
jgi:hypothetical protein